MTDRQVEQMADAVLYEGYILYPYRPSSIKNQYRWTFGVVSPRSYAEQQNGAEDWRMQTECLLHGSAESLVAVRVRFLQVSETDAIEREVACEVSLSNLVRRVRQQSFSFPVLGQDPGLGGVLLLSARQCADNVFKVQVRIENTTPLTKHQATNRNDAILRSLVSTHTILSIQRGEFISLLEPPEDLNEMATSCENIGTWPVLVGDRTSRDAMLSSPIILYDYPQIAPESHVDLFDGTEIDELLTLRVKTLTDDEKQEAATWDKRAGMLLERADSLNADQLGTLHGAIREMRRQTPSPSSVRVGEVELQISDRVRLVPQGRADAIDSLLRGKTATIESIEQDLENNVYIALTVDEDPGRDLGRQGKVGHRFFFRPDEIEPLT